MKAVLGTIGLRLWQYTPSSVSHVQKVTEDQCSPVWLKKARLVHVSGLLFRPGLPAFKTKKSMSYGCKQFIWLSCNQEGTY